MILSSTVFVRIIRVMDRRVIQLNGIEQCYFQQ